MQIINFLNTFDSLDAGLEAVEKQLGIKTKVYHEHEIVVFNYSQIDSPKTHPIVMECRGLILSYSQNYWSVLCRPFKRFFNYGEAPEVLTDFDFNRSHVYEKVDGSLIKVWYMDGKWHIGTRGTAFAESENYTGQVFRDMVVNAFVGDVEYPDQEFENISGARLSIHHTHLYEFTSPDNRIVTPYEKPEMVYLGSVDNYTGAISQLADSLIGNSRKAKTYSLSSMDDCVSAAEELEGLEEGFVVRDGFTSQAVKIKSPLYVKAHHLRGEVGLTPKKIAALVVTNETKEYLTYFPEDEGKIRPYAHDWSIIRRFAENVQSTTADIESQKEFALKVKDLPYAGALFCARKKGTGVLQELDAMRESTKIKMLLEWTEKNK